MRAVAVLFARRDSIYKTMPECDVYDIERDVLTYPGDLPIIAHPPCRSWGRLRKFAKPRPGEKELALWAVDRIRENGGVLEHPESSELWKIKKLPFGRERDKYGGWTLSVNQHWFGHQARKKTWLYICGLEPCQIPPYPLRFEPVAQVVGGSKYRGAYARKEVSKKHREYTPVEFAEFLVSVARKTIKPIIQ